MFFFILPSFYDMEFLLKENTCYATALGSVFIGLNLARQIHVIFEHLFSKV
jgi:hypothetical protein